MDGNLFRPLLLLSLTGLLISAATSAAAVPHRRGYKTRSARLSNYRRSSLRRRSRSDRESRSSDLAARYWCFQTPKRIQRSGGDLDVHGGGAMGVVAVRGVGAKGGVGAEGRQSVMYLSVCLRVIQKTLTFEI